MQCVELNPAGNFDLWHQEKIDELSREITTAIGQSLIFENENVKLWEIYIEPGERIPFRKHNANYSWVCPSGGLALTRHGNGKINMLKIDKGDTEYWEFKEKTYINDLENIGEEAIEINILEYKERKLKAFMQFAD